MNDEYDHLRESADSEEALIRAEGDPEFTRETLADHLCGRATCRHHFDHHSVNNPGCGCGIVGCPGREPTVFDHPFVEVEVTGTEIEFPKKSPVGTPKELLPRHRYILGNIHHLLLGLTGTVEALVEDLEGCLEFSPPDYTEPAPGQEVLLAVYDALNKITPDRHVFTILEANKK